jgi:hypothetical protein
MRTILLAVLIISSLHALAQEKQKFQLSFQLQPELSFHQNQYSYPSLPKYTKASFNTGLSTELQYNLTDKWFVNLGLGYISRRLNTAVFLDQGLLPPPHYSATKELNTTRYLSYRMFEMPVNVGYNFIDKSRFKSFITSGISANYLLNAYYNVGNPKYNGRYKKGYWQGVSVNCGIGTDIQLTKHLLLTNTLSYSFINKVQGDKYLFSQDAKNIRVTHKYLQLSIGVAIPFK